MSLKSFCKAASRLLLLRSSHSQIRIIFQPRAAKACVVSLSRSMFRVILAFQNGVLLLGSLKYLHPSWPCQKQPSTNMTVLYFFNTISGDPGSFLLFRRYRSPLLNKNFRTKISGLVSLPLIAAIHRLRCSGVITSAMAHLFNGNQSGQIGFIFFSSAFCVVNLITNMLNL